MDGKGWVFILIMNSFPVKLNKCHIPVLLLRKDISGFTWHDSYFFPIIKTEYLASFSGSITAITFFQERHFSSTVEKIKQTMNTMN